MNQQYYNISLPTNPMDIVRKLSLTTFSLLNNGDNNYVLGYCSSKKSILTINNTSSYKQLQYNNAYFFGYIPYDQKSHFLPKSQSNNPSLHHFNDSKFFSADGTFIFKNKIGLFFGTKKEYLTILGQLDGKCIQKKEQVDNDQKITVLKHRTSKKEYLDNVKQIKTSIQKGDIYEMNYCVTFESKSSQISCNDVYKKLKSRTKAPFTAYLSINDAIVLSASPERFIHKSGNKIISQPIKGTIKRGRSQSEDQKLIIQLSNDQKEISENIMIVDLVRNDMSKIANRSSVDVTELCKIYTFPTVHQLISTIQSEIPSDTNIFSILKSLFPMGSMTGAPKLKATQLIDKLENFKRGIYSGSIGFIAPNKSFDFNVVIRSIIHNKAKKTTSISVGSAITIKSDPRLEYSECLLKLSAIESSLE